MPSTMSCEGEMIGSPLAGEKMLLLASIKVEASICAAYVKGRLLVTAYLRDIQERQRSEEAKRVSEERLRALFEHGSDGLNELNLIRRGGNYGWPKFNGESDDPKFVPPILVHNSPPAGATFVSSDRYPDWKGNLLFAGLGLRQLVRVVLSDGAAPKVVKIERLLTGRFGRIRDVAQGPDGYLYIATSNTDGRGSPAPTDDRIIRLVPR